MVDLVGQTIGQYRIDAALDAGGMGQVYRGTHLFLDRPAAIKIMSPTFMAEPRLRARFLQEAKSAAALKHANIVGIYEFGEQNNLLYLVMELMTDGSLRGLLQKRAAGQYWPLASGLDYVRQAAEGLAAAHATGVIHRDIKPDNLLLTREDPRHPRDGQLILKISDFGLARLAEGSGLTSTGTPMGTLAYMSPEQWKGVDVDGRTDIYALGVVLYEVATGYQPFQVTTARDALYKHLNESPTPPRQIRSDISPALEAIILRCLEKNPDNRYASAGEMVQALQGVLGNVRDQTAISSQASLAPAEPVEGGTVLSAPSSNNSAVPAVVTLPGASSVPRVRVLDRGGTTLQVVEVSSQGLIVGRQTGNGIVLRSDEISRQHLQILWDGAQVSVKDLGSSNGTLLENIRLLPQVSQVWTERQNIRLGPFWLRLEGANLAQPTTVGAPAAFADTTVRPPSPPISAPPPSSDRSTDRFTAVIEPSRLTIVPGQIATFRIKVNNVGSIVDWLRPSIEGVNPEWVQMSHSEVQLNPGAQQYIDVHVNVARIPQNRAGDYPVVVRARSREMPQESVTSNGIWTVQPFRENGIKLEPRRVVAYTVGQYQLSLRNAGNAPALFRLTGEDDELKLNYLFKQDEVALEPGHDLRVPLTIKTAGHLLGREQRRPFQVHATPPSMQNQQPLAESGEFVSKAYIPPWVLPAVAAMLIAAIALAALLGLPPFKKAQPTTATVITKPAASSMMSGSATGMTPVALQQLMTPATPPAAAAAAQPSPPPAVTPPALAPATMTGTAPTKFVLQATSANMGGDSIVINNPLTNNNPNAVIIVTPDFGTGVADNHPIGVWYTGTNWTVFNEDAAAMPANASFNVWVMNSSNQAFVHQATTANIQGSSTVLDNPLINGNADAIILVTENWNPGNQTGIYNNHNIGVWYDGANWRVFNEDNTAMTPQASFNIYIVSNNNANAFILQSTTTNTNGAAVQIDNSTINGDGNAIIQVTQLFNPAGTGGVYNDHAVGVSFDGTHWSVQTEDQTAMTPVASFNVYIIKH